MESILNQLELYMKQNNISKYRVAKLSGISESNIYSMFSRNRPSTFDSLQRVANGLGLEIKMTLDVMQ
ncbi:helix-turn-helix domain-containing protein [Klebsiella quasivariicola]|uniref:helix-turn-helix domain-containing protein n=1 Tax=Klebsiella quasivariicola TaxID=2026240 RepID=UPI00247AB9EA|nr:helix-turn-helix transcriptional regulator [Klebsiella quasivariicola]